MRDSGELSALNEKLLAEIAERRRAEQRLTAQYTVARTLAETATLAEAAPRILQGICDCLGWVAGVIWTVDQSADLLRCDEFWHGSWVQLPDFETTTRGSAFARGVGLPGRVWASGEPAWIPDVTMDSNFPRAHVAQREGLHAGFAFPIRLDRELLGVIEFFNREIRQPDDQLLQMMTVLGSQIGQFIERKQTEQALREANRRKDEFLAMLAHELRNPLAPIRAGLDILRLHGAEDSTTQHTREMMERQVGQLVRLVDDLLDVSRIMRGKIDLHKEPVELETLLRRAVETAQPLIDAQRHRLLLSLPPESVWLDADAFRLAQVIANLLNNAAKFSEKASEIWLGAERSDNDVVIRVRDYGIGISPEMLPRVFDLFVQADQSIGRSHNGLGIGLSLAHRLVEMHGGRIEVCSAGLGQGSTFTVRIPALARSPEMKAPKDKRSSGPTPRRRILVVDDNVDVADSVATVLRLDGHDVRISHDAVTALEIADTMQPDIMFLDIGMPVVDGYELARRVRQRRTLAKTILVALTGWGQDDDLRRTREAGFDYHLVKPVGLAELEELLTSTSTKHHP